MLKNILFSIIYPVERRVSSILTLTDSGISDDSAEKFLQESEKYHPYIYFEKLLNWRNITSLIILIFIISTSLTVLRHFLFLSPQILLLIIFVLTLLKKANLNDWIFKIGFSAYILFQILATLILFPPQLLQPSIFNLSMCMYFIDISFICATLIWVDVIVYIRKSLSVFISKELDILSKKLIQEYHTWHQTEYRSYLESVNPRYSGYIYSLLYAGTQEVFYVGQTSNLKRRIKEHKKLKFLDINFYYKVIESKVDIDNIDSREIYWIAFLGGVEKLRNVSPGGSNIKKRTNSKWAKSVYEFENRYKEFYT